MKEATGQEVERHPVDEFFFELCPKLSLNQRLMGYALMVGIGFILNIGSWVRLVDLAHGNPGPFVTFFTVGNIISLLGSFFLNGPYAQGKKMVGPEMRCATLAYLSSMICTFIVAYHTGIKSDTERLWLILLLIVVQYLCMIWFIICSVTFLKRIVLACLKGTCTNMCPTCAKGCSCICESLEEAKVRPARSRAACNPRAHKEPSFVHPSKLLAHSRLPQLFVACATQCLRNRLAMHEAVCDTHAGPWGNACKQTTTTSAATKVAVATGVKKKEEKKNFFTIGNAT